MISTFWLPATCSGNRVRAVLPPALQQAEEVRPSDQATSSANHWPGGTGEARALRGVDPEYTNSIAARIKRCCFGLALTRAGIALPLPVRLSPGCKTHEDREQVFGVESAVPGSVSLHGLDTQLPIISVRTPLGQPHGPSLLWSATTSPSSCQPPGWVGQHQAQPQVPLGKEVNPVPNTVLQL